MSDLLDFARPYEPVVRDYAVADLVREVATESLHDARVRVVLAPNLPPVSMDPGDIRRALLNLVIHGLQALPANGIVTIAAGTEMRSGKWRVRLDVADDGEGIPPDVRATIFEPFFTTKASSTGLGLAIVQRIVEAHQGELAVDSSPSGTTFSIWLPL